MSVKWVWCPNHNMQQIQVRNRENFLLPLLYHSPCRSQVGIDLMNASQSKRYLNTLYMYKVDLL